VLLWLVVEVSQPNLHIGNDRNKCFRSSVSVTTFALFILAIATLQILSILISETPQRVYGQTQATVTDNNNNNIVRDLSWTSLWYDNNLKPTSSNVITIAASISDIGNNNSTPFLLPSPSSSQSSNNNSSTPAVGPASNTSPSNNVVNSDSSSQGHNSNKENSTNTHFSSSQTNIFSSTNNHVENQHKKHKHGSTVDIINQVVSQSKQQFTGGQIPFP